MDGAFYEAIPKLLKPHAFAFMLDAELKLAVRSQNFVTLILVEASNECEGVTVAADEQTLYEIAQICGKEIRDADLLGRTENGMLGVALWDADFDHSTSVIDRLVSRIENYGFPTSLQIAAGAACYPTHAVDLDSLRRQAGARPVVCWRAGTRAVAPRELR